LASESQKRAVEVLFVTKAPTKDDQVQIRRRNAEVKEKVLDRVDVEILKKCPGNRLMWMAKHKETKVSGRAWLAQFERDKERRSGSENTSFNVFIASSCFKLH
jgi:hypothetical protein